MASDVDDSSDFLDDTPRREGRPLKINLDYFDRAYPQLIGGRIDGYQFCFSVIGTYWQITVNLDSQNYLNPLLRKPPYRWLPLARTWKCNGVFEKAIGDDGVMLTERPSEVLLEALRDGAEAFVEYRDKTADAHGDFPPIDEAEAEKGVEL